MEQIAIIAVLIISIVLHEMAHGYAANALGDPTARFAGRLSPNPLVHLDPLGSVIIPTLLLFGNMGILFGWAKPVPYNPYNLTNKKYGEALVAAAGPAVNVLLAFIFAMIIRAGDLLSLTSSFIEIASYVVYINILLACFNMIPFPPLDGSKILMAFLPFAAQQKYRAMIASIERYGFLATFLVIFIFINIFWGPFSVIIRSIFELMTGLRWF